MTWEFEGSWVPQDFKPKGVTLQAASSNQWFISVAEACVEVIWFLNFSMLHIKNVLQYKYRVFILLDFKANINEMGNRRKAFAK